MIRPSGREVAAALLLDAIRAEPPEALHPVVWIGKVISAYERRTLVLKSLVARRVAGVVLAAVLPAVVFLAARGFLNASPRQARNVLEVILLWTTLSMRGLAAAATRVERELEGGRLGGARASVGEFVGRDTGGLSEPGVCRAAVESVAENTSDGVVAPMLYGALLGPPGALAYKAINTLDSMVGYREGAYLELGWASARVDDLANLVPSRLTVLAVAATSGHPVRVLAGAARYGPLTSSPNAGWAEAAFAGALELRLGGSNAYGGVVRESPELGRGRPPRVEDIRRAVALMRRSCALLALVAILFRGTRRG